MLAVAASATFASAPAQAVVIAPGTSGLIFTPFVSATQGTLLASTSVSGTALTFAGLLRAAVYRNTAGTLDFYYQVARTGAGSDGNQMIDSFTGADFSGYTVDGFVSTADPDGGGIFTAENNPGGSTTTTGRSSTGVTLQTDFGTNGLVDTENSATYIFRTNALDFTRGTFGVIDGSTFSGFAYEPTAVPEPAAWAMLIGGFGLTGASLRYRRRRTNVVFA
ncbi:MAG: PEPxxWA-CTERM sorting domain-containing protein [Sphingomonadaceae bacterium]|nr:PEPxxWA-CTERM sorting domain-containing protein [Sphingomonadaceae bacterium]